MIWNPGPSEAQRNGEGFALAARTAPLTPQEQLKRFRLPPGFKIELVAAEPEVPKPINLSFDARGRLYVTCSTGYPIRAATHEAKDKIVVLSDGDGDGQFDRQRTLVDGLNIPIGVAAAEQGVVFYSIPEIHRWTGDVEDPKAGTNAVLHGTFGCQDTHGMVSSCTPWIDGWIYACHGFANVSTVAFPDGRAITFRGGNTFRMRADGSDVEYFTHGQVNPFGLTFDPLGNLFSADSTTLPAYQLLRGASYPSAEGGGFDGLGPGPAMMNHLHGSTCIAGIVYYAADAFPAEYRDTLFIGNPVTGRVNHDRLERHGTTMLAIEQPDFLTCSDPWFRPVDLKLGPDGALYVADFYNAVIGHVELPLTHPARDHGRGRIWRISSTSDRAQRLRTPDMDGAPVEELVSLLSDANLTVRVLATEALVARGWCPEEKDLAADDRAWSDWRRAHLLWLRERLAPGGLSPEVVDRLAHDPAACVRVHLMKALAERADWGPTGGPPDRDDVASLVRRRLSDRDPFVRRAAAEALGRHAHIANVKPLLDLWREVPADDTHLAHVVAMAVRDHFVFLPGLYAKLDDSITADPENERLLMQANLAAPGAVAVERQIDFLRRGRVGPGDFQRFIEGLLPAVSQLQLMDLCAVLNQVSEDHGLLEQAKSLELLRGAAQIRAIRLPDSTYQWCESVVMALFRGQAQDVAAAIELAGRYELSAAYPALLRLASRDSPLPELRAKALAAAMTVDFERSLPLALEIIDAPEQTLLARQAAVRALGAANRESGREELARRLNIEPFGLAAEIAAELAGDRLGAKKLLAAVEESSAPARLLDEVLVSERLKRTAPAEERVPHDQRKATADAREVARLVEFRRNAFLQAKPDAASGQRIFSRLCGQCHAVGGRGGTVGPALDAIGNRGVERLLEDILAPSRNIAPEFRASLVALSDGRTVFGRMVRQDAQGIVLADAEGKENWFPATDVDELWPSAVSVMPANMADSIAESDFNDLLGFLLSQRAK